MKILIFNTIVIWFFIINCTFASDDESVYQKLIKITIDYNEKTDPNFLTIKIKNTSDHDLDFFSLPDFTPYYISIYSTKIDVLYIEDRGVSESRDLIERKILKEKEEVYKFDLSKVFFDKNNKYQDAIYNVEVSLSAISAKGEKGVLISSGKIKLNLKCKFEETQEKAKIALSFPKNKVLIEKKNINFRIELQNLTAEELIFLDEFSFIKTFEIVFLEEKYKKKYVIGRIVNWWEQKPDEPFSYIKLKPNEIKELKIPISEEMINRIDLPKGKYKVYARYGVTMGENCFKGFLRSDDIVVEKE